MEEWRKIIGYPGYKVSSYGHVRNSVGYMMKLRQGPRGLPTVELIKNGKYKKFRVCDLVANAFLGSPTAKFIGFKDHDTTNNRADNLYYSDKRHYVATGPVGKRVRVIETGHIYPYASKAAEEFGAARASIWRALQNPNFTVYGLHLEYVED